MFDFCTEGRLLGSFRDFNQEFASRISRANDRCATTTMQQLGKKLLDLLKQTIEPYLLRRTKGEIQARSKKQKLEEVCMQEFSTFTLFHRRKKLKNLFFIGSRSKY